MSNKKMLLFAGAALVGYGLWKRQSTPLAQGDNADTSWNQWGAPVNPGPSNIGVLPPRNQQASMPQMPAISAVPNQSPSRSSTPSPRASIQPVAPSRAQMQQVSRSVAVEPLMYSPSPIFLTNSSLDASGRLLNDR
jgi:hypothetical protein